MPRKSDEILRGLIGDIGTMIDARIKTLEININANVDKVVRDSEKRIRKDMATKDDIKNMATKDDIKNMATKDDIKNMATKDDIKRLELKMDKTEELRQQLEELKRRVKIIEENSSFHNQ